MRVNSSLTEDQRQAAAAWFEKGLADTAAATFLGVSRWPVRDFIGGGRSMVKERW